MNRDHEKHCRAKILSASEVAEAIGPRPRERKVIMCHGTFDVVHPGHIRHLFYAASKADVTVVSLTTDEHIKKANFRPFVPEELRAMNLAALSCVDYVVIDRNETPLENLRVIKPDYFAKGYEYHGDGELHPRTLEEKLVLDSFGGELLFTPGDIVFSSSAIIENQRPNLAAEKLLALMEPEGLSFRDFHETLDKLKGIRVHVVGDTIVDSYSHCSLIGGNTKTPTFSVRYHDRADFAGGAAVVAKHIRAAGGDVLLSTVLGDDALRAFVLEDLERAGVIANAIVDPTRPTTNKNAFIASGYNLLKVDTVDNRSIGERILGQLCEAISRERADAVVFSDFRHGIFNRDTCPTLIGALPSGTYRVADSQVASRWGNILEFPGFDLITPNEREARFALGDQDSVVRPLALELYRRAACKTLILKLGDRGALVYRQRDQLEDVRSFFALESFAGQVVDAVGSGDALLAYSTLAMVARGNEVIAGVLGSLAAAVACEREGNVPVAPAEVRAKLETLERRARFQ
jgi:rfaE bifunctional protein kinase chain/domain